ncbi:AAA family ATPase|nr:AAA family ATPase [Rhizobium altiplani]
MYEQPRPESIEDFAARQKGDPGNNGEGMHEKARNGRAKRMKPFSGLISSKAFIDQMKPPEFTIKDLLMRAASYTLCGPTGAGKTLVAILMAIKVARGEWFHGKKCRKGKVAFFAAENPENVRYQYFSICADLDIDPRAQDIEWHKNPFDIAGSLEQTRAALLKIRNLEFVVFDSLQALFPGDDENSNMQMLDFACCFRDLIADHPNRPATLILAHPVKHASKDNLLPRGGGALLNELDGNLTVWADGGMANLHWQGKLRGIPFDPMKFELVVIKPEGLENADGDQMAMTIAKPLTEGREAEIHQQQNREEIATLEALVATPSISMRALAATVGVSRRRMEKIMETLTKRKWIRTYIDHIGLTREGERALRKGQK